MIIGHFVNVGLAVWTILKGLAASIWYWIMLIYTPITRPITSEDVALVTGGGGGIGLLTVINLAKKGATVVIWDINKAVLASAIETMSQVEEIDMQKVFTYVVDVADRKQVYEAAEQVQRDIGDVTVLVNNAGISGRGHYFCDEPDDVTEKIFRVNVLGNWWVLKAFLPRMQERNYGSICCISSISGIQGSTRMANYASSKSAIDAMMRCLRIELRDQGFDGIHLTTIFPYFISTGLFEGSGDSRMGFMSVLKPEYVADKIVDSIERKKPRVITPRIGAVGPLVVSLPPPGNDHFLGLFGCYEVMNHFTGRPVPAERKGNDKGTKSQ